MPQVLTANRLGPGEVVYWKPGGGWAEALHDAALFEGQDSKEALEGAAESVRRREVVNPYLFEVRIDEGRLVPVKAREMIRAAGPTVRLDLGKQANR